MQQTPPPHQPPDRPEEGVAGVELVERGAELHLGVVAQVAPDGAQGHGEHHEQDRQQELRDQTLPVSAAVMEPLDENGRQLLPGQSHPADRGGARQVWVQEEGIFFFILLFIYFHFSSLQANFSALPSFTLNKQLTSTDFIGFCDSRLKKKKQKEGAGLEETQINKIWRKKETKQSGGKSEWTH